MLPKNRKINIAIVAGMAVIAGGYFWYQRRKRICKVQFKEQRNPIDFGHIDAQYGDEREHRNTASQDAHSAPEENYFDKEPSFNTDNEEELLQPDHMHNVEEVLNDTKLMVLKHMFLITEGMTASERVSVYEKLAHKINVIERGEGLYDVKWRP